MSYCGFETELTTDNGTVNQFVVKVAERRQFDTVEIHLSHIPLNADML